MGSITIGFIATFLIWFLYMGLVVLWFIDGKIRKEQVIHAIAAGILAWLVAHAIKEIFPTLRPFMLNGESTDVLIRPMDSAFPSAHTALAFSLAITIFMHDRKVGWWYLTAALVIGIGRVLANVHYPIDILGGALIGSIIAVVIEKTHLFNLLSGNKKKK